jgi:hypothetical protein
MENVWLIACACGSCQMKQNLIYTATLLLIGLLGYIIWSATTEHPSIFFRIINQAPYGDKLSHFLLVGLLTLLVNLSFRNRRISIGSRKWLLGSVLVLIVITLEELSQSLIPSRELDAMDLLANYLGVLVFGHVAKYLVPRAVPVETPAT